MALWNPTQTACAARRQGNPTPLPKPTPIGREEAQALTDQIRVAVDHAWSLIIEAYHRRVWVALEYPSWDDYCESEFGGLRLKLPREDRQEVVASMRDAGMSIRAIASATGASKSTVTSDVSQIGTPAESDIEKRWAKQGSGKVVAETAPQARDHLAKVIGIDGKEYAQRASVWLKPSDIPDPVRREERAAYTAIIKAIRAVERVLPNMDTATSAAAGAQIGWRRDAALVKRIHHRLGTLIAEADAIKGGDAPARLS